MPAPASVVEPLFLQVELTESCLIADAESAMKLLAEIRRLGCQIALDDFGTGYSSLSYLRRLPLDILKIDRSFISGIGEEQGDSNLAFSILGIGRSLGLKVIAEGVASARAVGCAVPLAMHRSPGIFDQPAGASLPQSRRCGSTDAGTRPRTSCACRRLPRHRLRPRIARPR